MTRRRVLVTLIVWIVLSVSLAATDARPSVIILAGIVAVAGAALLMTLDLAHAVAPIEWTVQRRVRHTVSVGDQRVGSLRNQLYSARWLGSTELRDTLVDLVDDRLLAHRHIDRATDPFAALEALTPTLRRLVEGPRRPGTSARELDRILADIEGL